MPQARQPRTVPPERALPEPAVGASQAAGVAAATGIAVTVAGTAAGAGGTLPLVPILKGGQETLEKILETIRGFQVLAAAREDRWITDTLLRVDSENLQAILETVADERARRAEFDRRVTDRVRVKATRALQLPDPVERRRALGNLLDDERRFAEQRAAAVAERTLALADRVTLRRESPGGAYWDFVEDERVTPDCRAMGGRFWPWPVLDQFHPPTHTGCRCRLESRAWALDRGLIRPGDVLDVDEALRLARRAMALLHEAEGSGLREALERTGLASGARLDAALREAARRSSA